MLLSEIPIDVVKNYANIFFSDDDYLIENFIMPSAKGFIESYTKRTEEELENYPEIGMAYLILCTYLYDNRSLELSDSQINFVLKQTLGMHSNFTF